jgi:hypothetical protein
MEVKTLEPWHPIADPAWREELAEKAFEIYHVKL